MTIEAMNEQTRLHPAPEIEWPEDLTYVRPLNRQQWAEYNYRHYVADGLAAYDDVRITVRPEYVEVKFMDYEIEDPKKLRHLVNQLRAALLVMEAEEAARVAHATQS